jgi:flavin reductase (DIM6/NTAB) family NADH-FMN oxidoreductase RutF
MNIVTFATPVSVDPNQPKLWVVSLYHGTLTKDSFFQSGCGVLQLLTPRLKGLVDVLGKHSGYRAPTRDDSPFYDKREESAKRGHPWVESGPWMRVGNAMGPADLIPRCASYVFLKHLGKQLDAGDHVVVLCKVLATGRWDEDKGAIVDAEINQPPVPQDQRSALYTGQLREEGLL